MIELKDLEIADKNSTIKTYLDKIVIFFFICRFSLWIN